MSGSLLRKGIVRSMFGTSSAADGTPLPLARKLVWVGALEADVARDLAGAGWDVVSVPLGDGAIAAVGRSGAEVAVVDFGDGDGAAFAGVDALVAAYPKVQWLAVAGKRALEFPQVCELIHDRFFDFFIPPVRTSKFAAVLGHAWGKTQLLPSAGRATVRADLGLGLVGASQAIDHVRERLRKFAGFDLPVLLTGETGTGKDVAARAIHACSARSKGPFVAINCGAIPENLVQSELFGHERGAFTGATARKIGRIEAADGGIVLLDEIGDLPMEAQCNLLRFLEAHTIERVGSTRSIEVNARVIAATHVDLPRAVAEGRFREDLYYRLNVLHVEVPPLRERHGDIEVLARHFLDQFRLLHRTHAGEFSAGALRAIAAHPWPGNVRELINRVHSAAVVADRRLIDAADLGLGEEPPQAMNLQTARAQIERETIADHLRASGFNMSECARRLEISRVTLYRLCKKYGLKTDAAALPLVLAGVLFEFDIGAPPLVASCAQWANQAAMLLSA